MDVMAKEGPMFLQGVKFGKKIWKSIYVMMFQPSPSGIGRIEFYNTRDGNAYLKSSGLRKGEKRVIRLADCLSVMPGPGESCPPGSVAFYLNTTERIFTLAAPVQDEWVPALCQLAFQKNEVSGETMRSQRQDDLVMEDNNLYTTLSPSQFLVNVVSSVASQRRSISGSYLLSPEKDSLSLLDMKTGKVVFNWPYQFLRKFGLVKDGVCIEAGRLCQAGEGKFTFLSKQGPQIYSAIKDAIMHQKVQELLQQPMTPEPLPRTSKASPTMDVSQRNLALPSLPCPEPPASSSQPIYATVKPQPKPRSKLPGSATPVPRPRPDLPPMSPTQEEHDYEVCNWVQEAESCQDKSDEQQYSVVSLPPQNKRRNLPDTLVQPEDSQAPPEVPPTSADSQTDFKQALSVLLFKDTTRAGPSLPPKPFQVRSSSEEPEDFDYYEIQN